VRASSYPGDRRARGAWVLGHRGAKASLDPWIPYAFFREEEIGSDGRLVPTAVVLLTNRECPLRCLMCDLWKNTLDERVPRGAIAAQIRHALERLPPVRAVKLYNAGSFFDPNAIPPVDYEEVAGALAGLDRVVVECHPAFLGERALRFRDAIGASLEVAIGLESVQPGVLERLNKGMTIASFERAAAFLARHSIALRVFLMLRPPFTTEREGVTWTRRSIELAARRGATACCVIPTRGGNGAMEALGDAFQPPALRSLERVVELGIEDLAGAACRVFADLWDVERLFRCRCSPERAARLETMNRTQRVPPRVSCDACHDAETYGDAG
jgi:radical SAM enzyme (TIGR01210 family)